MPEDSASQQAMIRSILDAIIDEELLVQKAKDEKVEVSDNDVNADVDKRMQTIRTRFTTEKEFRDELKKSGFGTVDEFRRWLADQSRRSQLQQKLFEKLRTRRQDRARRRLERRGRRVLRKNSSQLQKLPATVTLRQIVIAPKPTPRQDSRGAARRRSRCTSRSRRAETSSRSRSASRWIRARRSSAAISAGVAAATSFPSSIACTSRCGRAS